MRSPDKTLGYRVKDAADGVELRRPDNSERNIMSDEEGNYRLVQDVLVQKILEDCT